MRFPLRQLMSGRLEAQFARFLVSGGLSAGADLLGLAALLALGVHRSIASAVAFLVSGIVNYLLHRRFTFDSAHASNAGEVLRFAVSSAVNAGVTVALIELFYRGLGLPVMVAKVLSLPFVAALGFAVGRWWVFVPRTAR